MEWKFVNNDIVLQAQRRKTLEIMDASNHWTQDLEKHLSSILIYLVSGITPVNVNILSLNVRFGFVQINFDDKRYVSNIFEQYMPMRVAMQMEFHLLIFLFFCFSEFCNSGLGQTLTELWSWSWCKIHNWRGDGKRTCTTTDATNSCTTNTNTRWPPIETFLHNKYKYKMTTNSNNHYTTNTNTRWLPT